MGLLKNLLSNSTTDQSDNTQGILSASESAFMRILIEIVDAKGYLIFPKVPLTQFITISEKDKSKAAIEHKLADFIICDRTNFRPVLGIELDDSTNNRPDTAQRDYLVNRLFEDASIGLIRVAVQREYDAENLSDEIASYLK
jgi:hypothetical protein